MTVEHEGNVFEICPDIILRPALGGASFEWVFSNPRTRTHVHLDQQATQSVLKLAHGASGSTWLESLSEGSGWDRTRFTNADGLLADPTGIGFSDRIEAGETLFKLLRNRWIIQRKGGEDYSKYLAPKSSILDRAHLGTFHENVGSYQKLDLRLKETWRWWHDQKFTSDGKEIRSGLYRWVQGYFFDSYFGNKDLKGSRLLDFGCGNGYYSGKFHARGAEVVGLDTSSELLSIAEANHQGSARFVKAIDQSDCMRVLSSFESSSFDFVYLSDVLLFYFYELGSKESYSKDLSALLKEFRRLLKDDGRLYLMEPNGTFWLAPWLGSSVRPMTVITEYHDKLYQVAPTPDRVIAALSSNGFYVESLLHPNVDPAAEHLDARAYKFAKAFPLWDFYSAIPAPQR